MVRKLERLNNLTELTRAPTLGLWGVGTVGTLLFFSDSIPVLRRGIFDKIPYVNRYYDDSVDPQDSPY